MRLIILLAALGFQPPPAIDHPPPAPRVDRKVPPPIPQPPVSSSVVNPPAVSPPAVETAPTGEPPVPIPVQKQVQHTFLRQHDVNQDGRLEPAELEKRFAKHFLLADLNRDGFLDVNEIIYDRHNIGRAARRMEGLDLDRDGRLVWKSEKPALPIANIARGVIDALDPNGDGVIEGREVGDAVRREVIPRIGPKIGVEITSPPTALPTRPTNLEPSIDVHPAPSTNQKPAPPAPAPTRESKQGQGASKKDDLPSAEVMIANLDKDGDGQLSESEAVDQLAKNFKTLDRNHDGKLSKDEIERGLRLARLFGIKPMKPPETYRDGSVPKTPATPK